MVVGRIQWETGRSGWGDDFKLGNTIVFISMWNLLISPPASFWAWCAICAYVLYACPFMKLCFSVHKRLFPGFPALSYLGYNYAEMLNIHILPAPQCFQECVGANFLMDFQTESMWSLSLMQTKNNFPSPIPSTPKTQSKKQQTKWNKIKQNRASKLHARSHGVENLVKT